MATRALLAVVLHILALPLVGFSCIMILLNFNGLALDFRRCLEAVDATPTLPPKYVTTLVAAEDHRSAFHPGVDVIGILRAIFVRARLGKIQGASTIEQQFVRVVLGRYEKTLYRKFREQMIAIGLAFQRPKAKIAMAYLCVAFYGSGQNGFLALKRICGSQLEAASQGDISKVIARLKYPEPLSASHEWCQKIDRRVEYIARRTKGLAFNGFLPDQIALGGLRGKTQTLCQSDHVF